MGAPGQISNGIVVLKLAACGYSDAEIAAKLFIAPETIRSRMKAFYKETRTRNRHHALALALLKGWITLDEIQESVFNLKPEKKKNDDT